MTSITPYAVLVAVALSGCTVGPDFEPPKLSTEAGYSAASLPRATVSSAGPNAEAQNFIVGTDIPGEWWSLFQSPALDALVRQAIRNNPDIAAAQAAIKVGRELTRAQTGADYPAVTGGFSATRQLTPLGSLTPTAATSSSVYTLYTAQLAVSYMPDIWGVNARTVEALQAQDEIRRFQYEAAFLTLTSNVVIAAITEAELRGQIEAATEIIALEEESLALLQRQYDLGQIANADVLAQESALAQAQQTLPPLQKQLDQTRNFLTALLGRFPNQEPAENFTLNSMELPHEIPVTLPSRLVEQRPDVRAAQASLHASTALVGVAIANRLPNITLGAAIGATAPFVFGAQGLAGKDMEFWSMSGNWAAVLFDGFSLEHKQKAAEYGLEQAAAQYRSAVLTAFANVSDSLHALQSDAQNLKAAVRAEQSAAATLAITRRQLELGAIPYLTLISAQQTELQAKTALVQARATRFADTVALFQSLGGGWWNRPDLENESQPR